jgi:hypothetical protein
MNAHKLNLGKDVGFVTNASCNEFQYVELT